MNSSSPASRTLDARVAPLRPAAPIIALLTGRREQRHGHRIRCTSYDASTGEVRKLVHLVVNAHRYPALVVDCRSAARRNATHRASFPAVSVFGASLSGRWFVSGGVGGGEASEDD